MSQSRVAGRFRDVVMYCRGKATEATNTPIASAMPTIGGWGWKWRVRDEVFVFAYGCGGLHGAGS